MLLKLLPDQIAKYWPEIEVAIKESVSLEILAAKNKLVNILENLLSGIMQCWWLVDETRTEDNEPIVLACLTTTIFYDNCSKTNGLRIYSLFGFEDIPERCWLEGLQTLRAFAKANSCEYIDAFTENKYIIQKALECGGQVKFTYITVGV